MALEADPHRVLGLTRGASLDEVKRAYRRLAKANHPDAAGIAALPRFLAIQAAYEQLGGSAGAPGAKPRGPAPSGPRRASAADQERADATRRAYGGRPRDRTRPPEPEGGEPETPGSEAGNPGGAAAGAGPARPRPSGRRPAGRRADPGRPPGGARPAGDASSDDRPSSSGTKGRRGKATLGSTSYDGADASPFEPDWGGASWYGTTSGTYWTINPKEYADPRKHGPEYQARARRSSTSRAGTGAAPDDAPGTLGSEPGAPESGPASTGGADEAATGGEPRGRASARPAHSTASWWSSTGGAREAGGPAGTSGGGAGGGAERAPTPGDRQRSAPPAPEQPFRYQRPPDESAPDPARAAADLARAIMDPHFGGLRGRILRAFFGWLPIAFGLGWLFGELTGCGRFAATCDTSVNPLILAIQGAALVALVLVPAVASLAASAALSLLVAAVGAALVLSATGSAADEESRRATLGALLLAAWIAGLVVAGVRRLRSVFSGVGPVS